MVKQSNTHIHVSCAIIEQDGRVLAARRSTAMSLPMKWEFPGGKIKSGESAEQGLRREIREELDVTIEIRQALPPSTHTYPAITVTLYPFVCSIVDGDINLREHNAVVWLPPDQLGSLDWAEADIPVLETYRRGPKNLQQ